MYNFIISIILLLTVAPSEAKVSVRKPIDLPVGYINTGNGLSHSTVHNVYLDEFGLVWIATGDGLNRFDGKKVELIKTPSNIITGITGNKNGTLFIKGHHTLYGMNLRTLEVSTISSDNVVSMAYRNGSLFWSSKDTVFREGKSIYKLESNETIIDIEVDGDGNIYIALSDGEILKISDTSRIAHFHHTGVLYLDYTPDGNMWACSRTEGVMRIGADESTRSYKMKGPEEMDENNARCVVEKEPGKYFVGTYKGLFMLDLSDNSFTPVHFQPGLAGFHNQAVRSITYENNTLFICTFHAGLHYWHEQHGIVTISGLSSPVVSAIAEDKNGNIWFGTVSGGLNIIDENSPLPDDFKKKILSDSRLNNIKYLLFDPQTNAIWVALFSEGIYKIDLDRFVLKKIDIPFFTENITRLQLIDDSKILCYCVDGLFTIDAQTLEVSLINGFPFKKERIIDFQYDGKSIWLTGVNAVYRIESIDTPYNYNRYPLSLFPEIRDENSITKIFKTNSGHILLCSNGSGLYRYDPEENKFYHLITDDVVVNYISQQEGSEDILISTNNGLIKLKDKQWTTASLNKHSGYPFSTVDIAYETKESTIFIGGTNSMYVIEKGASHTIQEDYDLYVLHAYAEGSELTPSPLYNETIKLKGPVRSLSFDIFNSSLDKSANTAFEYCMKGFDNAFSPTFNSIITYTNIPPGKYTLCVRSTIRTASGDYPHVELPIVVSPPFYKTKWFVLLLILLVSGVLAVIISSISRANKLKLELKIKQHDEELFQKFSKDKTAFITGFANQFRGPLTLVGSNIEAIMRREKNSAKNLTNLREAYNNIETLNGIVDRVSRKIDFSEEIEPSRQKDEVALQTIIEVVEKNIFNESFDVNEFASSLCMSRTTLFHKIKDLTGLTPNAFILSVKLRRAVSEMEANPDENISSLAYKCGFATPSYFIKCFKRYYGKTPLEFKKSVVLTNNKLPD